MKGRLGAVVQHVSGRRPMMTTGHRHLEWEFNLVTRGRAAYAVAGRRVQMELDSLLLLLPTQTHVMLERSPDFLMWVVVVNPERLRELAGDEAYAPWRGWLDGAPPEEPPHRLIGEEAARRLDALCGRLSQPAWDQAPPSATGCARHAAGLLWLAAEAWDAFIHAPDHPAGTHLHPAVQRALTFLAEQAHLPECEDLDALAARCAISRPHLSRLFAEQVGQTLTEFRTQQRVRRFTTLIGRGRRLNLTQAAFEAGFGSYAQAFRALRQLTGKSPRDYVRGSVG
jgi:AraC-like DNA-binding protein